MRVSGCVRVCIRAGRYRVILVYFLKRYVVETISPYRFNIYYFDVALRGTVHFSDAPLF